MIKSKTEPPKIGQAGSSWVIRRHDYDIDVFNILDELRSKIQTSRDKARIKNLEAFDFIKDDEQFFVDFMKSQGVDLTEQRKYRNYILPSTYNNYFWYLGWKLLVVDIYKLEAVLSYQAISYEGNYYGKKDNFTGLVEFIVYNFMRQRVFKHEDLRLEKLMNWVERNRNIVIDTSTSIRFTPLEFRPFSIDDAFAKLLCQELRQFFPKEQYNDVLKAIINGDVARGICFYGKMNVLVELFKRLRYNKKIVVEKNDSLGQWIIDVFCVKDKNGTQGLKAESVLSILRRTRYEPKRKDIILEDIAPYKSIASRKKQETPSD